MNTNTNKPSDKHLDAFSFKRAKEQTRVVLTEQTLGGKKIQVECLLSSGQNMDNLKSALKSQAEDIDELAQELPLEKPGNLFIKDVAHGVFKLNITVIEESSTKKNSPTPEEVQKKLKEDYKILLENHIKDLDVSINAIDAMLKKAKENPIKHSKTNELSSLKSDLTYLHTLKKETQSKLDNL